jgi:hypothetical protein
MLANEFSWESEKLRFLRPNRTVVRSFEHSDIEECDDQEIESINTFLLHWESAVAVRGVSTLDLYRDFREFAFLRLIPRLWMNANQIIPFVVSRGFIGQNVSAHKEPTYMVLCASRDDGKAEELLFGHAKENTRGPIYYQQNRPRRSAVLIASESGRGYSTEWLAHRRGLR